MTLLIVADVVPAAFDLADWAVVEAVLLNAFAPYEAATAFTQAGSGGGTTVTATGPVRTDFAEFEPTTM
jgi:hypothetical protein